MQNYYEILEVSPNASSQVIDKAYRVLAMKYHPDVQPRDKVFWAEAQLKQINEAYEVLSNPEKRHEYNIKIGLIPEVQNSYSNTEADTSNYENKSEKKGIFGNNQNSNYNTSPGSVLKHLNIRSSLRNIGQLAYNETKKSKEERSKDIKALILTAIIMAILIFAFLKVPFLRHLLSM